MQTSTGDLYAGIPASKTETKGHSGTRKCCELQSDTRHRSMKDTERPEVSELHGRYVLEFW